MTDAPAFERIRYERPDPQVVRVVLDRPETRNAQDRAMLYELDRPSRWRPWIPRSR